MNPKFNLDILFHIFNNLSLKMFLLQEFNFNSILYHKIVFIQQLSIILFLASA